MICILKNPRRFANSWVNPGKHRKMSSLYRTALVEKRDTIQHPVCSVFLLTKYGEKTYTEGGHQTNRKGEYNMFCMNCGKNIGDQTICPFCGCDHGAPEQGYEAGQPSPYQPPAQPEAPVYQAPMYQPPVQQETPVYQAPVQPEAPVYQAPVQPEAPVYQAPAQPEYGYGGGYQQPYGQQFAPAGIPAEPKKKKKTGLIIGVIAAAVVLLAGAGVLVFFLTADARAYSKAMSLKDDGKYQEAIAAFTELGDYDDAGEQITDCKYLEAKQKLAKGQYDEAISAFTALGNYKDSRDMIKQCDYERAMQLYSSREYEEAGAIFASLGNYSDSADKVKMCDYAIAKSLIDSDPLDAIDRLEALGGYADSDDLINQAKMAYCRELNDDRDTTTYQFLKELKAAGYPGAADFYNELYTYRVTNVFWNTDTENKDPSSAVKTLSAQGNIVLHFTLLGGTPDDTDMIPKYTVTWPNGTQTDKQYTKRARNYTLILTNTGTGTVKVQIYTDDGTLLHTATINVTD